MKWRDAVLRSLTSYCDRHGTAVFERQPFLNEKLQEMVLATESKGATPHQTVSRVLQELREEGEIRFIAPGRYLMLHQSLPVEREDLGAYALELAIRSNRLTFGTVATADASVVRRQRKGQALLRRISRHDYGFKCAVCSVNDKRWLVASHIARWADYPEHRGNLRNVMCLCRMHDALFEHGYWSLDSRYTIIRRGDVQSEHIRTVLRHYTRFTPPIHFPPDPMLLKVHHVRTGLTNT